jgi:hypothetical protein
MAEMSNKVTVYVALLGEGVDVWRPVQAEHLGDDRYRLTGEQPDGEAWPFASGDVVTCKEHTLSGDWGPPERALVAYKKST